jgi:hypothetical protein
MEDAEEVIEMDEEVIEMDDAEEVIEMDEEPEEADVEDVEEVIEMDEEPEEADFSRRTSWWARENLGRIRTWKSMRTDMFYIVLKK